MEALVFGESTEVLDPVSHNTVALFEQYEPLDAMNDEIASYGRRCPARPA